MRSIISTGSIPYLYRRYAYLYKACDGEIEHFGFDAKNINQLNWLSFDDLDNNCDIIEYGAESGIRALLCDKTQIDKGKFNCARYVGNTIMAQMANFEYARQMTYCGTIGNATNFKRTPCSKWKYCERCANARRRFVHLKYAHVYSATSEMCYFVTITTELEDKVKFIDGNRHKVIEAWDKMHTYVDSMYAKKMITGALVVEEAAFDSYYPHPVMNPHIHMVCTGKELRDHKFEGLKINVKLINSEEHWVAELNYINKSINFFSPYVADWTPERAVVINRNFKDMLDNHKQLVLNRNQSRAIGTFHAKNKNAVCRSSKEIRASNKKTGQMDNKKIKCNDMPFENFKDGFKSHLAQLQKTSNVGVAPVQKKQETPWYKNPLVLAGGGLALGAGVYGAGKMYNGGDNMVNDTYGKAIDDYVVKPISGLFSKREERDITPAQQNTTPTPEQSFNFKTLPVADNPSSTKAPTFQIPNVLPNTNNAVDTIRDFRSNPLEGVSPLKPELHREGLSLAPNARDLRLVDKMDENHSSQLNISEYSSRIQQALNGTSRERDMLHPELTNKTPEELTALYQKVQALKDYTGGESRYRDIRNYAGSMPGTAPIDTTGNALTTAGHHAGIYDLAMLGGSVDAVGNKIDNVASRFMNPATRTGAAQLLRGLTPATTAIANAPSGWALGQDIAEDPSNKLHQVAKSLGLSEEQMKYVGAGAVGVGSGVGESLMLPGVRAAINRAAPSMLARSLVAGGEAAAGGLALSPPVAIGAGIAATVASPVNEMVLNNAVGGHLDKMENGNRLTTFFKQFRDAKGHMDNYNEAHSMKALLDNPYFKNLGNNPADVKSLYENLGDGPANALMMAKKEGIMSLLAGKLKDLMANSKYKPAPEPEISYANNPPLF